MGWSDAVISRLCRGSAWHSGINIVRRLQLTLNHDLWSNRESASEDLFRCKLVMMRPGVQRGSLTSHVWISFSGNLLIVASACVLTIVLVSMFCTIGLSEFRPYYITTWLCKSRRSASSRRRRKLIPQDIGLLPSITLPETTNCLFQTASLL